MLSKDPYSLSNGCCHIDSHTELESGLADCVQVQFR